MRFLIALFTSYILLILLVCLLLLIAGDFDFTFLLFFLFYASPAFFIFIPLSHFFIVWIRKRYDVIRFIAYLLAGFVSGFICLLFISQGRFYTDWPAAISLLGVSCVGHLIFYFCYQRWWKGVVN
ncbi:hypothetical protein ACI2JA_11095 [Alkalihalobacillus sp. NPDC078783]